MKNSSEGLTDAKQSHAITKLGKNVDKMYDNQSLQGTK